jgi:hypothetical protein
MLTLSIRHVTIVPFGNKAFFWLSGTKNLSAANRKAVNIHVTTPVICISERFLPHTAHSRHLKGNETTTRYRRMRYEALGAFFSELKPRISQEIIIQNEKKIRFFLSRLYRID